MKIFKIAQDSVKPNTSSDQSKSSDKVESDTSRKMLTEEPSPKQKEQNEKLKKFLEEFYEKLRNLSTKQQNISKKQTFIIKQKEFLTTVSGQTTIDLGAIRKGDFCNISETVKPESPQIDFEIVQGQLASISEGLNGLKNDYRDFFNIIQSILHDSNLVSQIASQTKIDEGHITKIVSEIENISGKNIATASQKMLFKKNAKNEGTKQDDTNSQSTNSPESETQPQSTKESLANALEKLENYSQYATGTIKIDMQTLEVGLAEYNLKMLLAPIIADMQLQSTYFCKVELRYQSMLDAGLLGYNQDFKELQRGYNFLIQCIKEIQVLIVNNPYKINGKVVNQKSLQKVLGAYNAAIESIMKKKRALGFDRAKRYFGG
jgi:hypothetical protein